MPIISHISYTPEDKLETIITKDDGTPLQGEIDMFRRIYADCQSSKYTWHFWHNLRLQTPIKRQSEIQIDFLLICEKGTVIVEVKGGVISIEGGQYYYQYGMSKTPMNRSPFDQAEDYKYSLINNRIFNTKELFLDTVCAFPHTEINHTNSNPILDLGYKLWSQRMQQESNLSFSDFCINVLEQDKLRKNWRGRDLNNEEVKIAIDSLLFNFKSNGKGNFYSETSLESILNRLKIDNLSSFNSLRKNDRLFIEGGPGTGKTTIARAYIEKYHTLRGLYLCWNKLLKSKIENELKEAYLTNCEVAQFESFIFKLIKNYAPKSDITIQSIENGTAIDDLIELFHKVRTQPYFIPYDYVIIDEAQDTIDKGAVQLLNSFSSISDNGIQDGRYLVFYDTNQGYKNKNRRIEELADSLRQYGANFILDENKRVPTNKEIVSYAEYLLGESCSTKKLFDQMVSDQHQAVKVFDNLDFKGLVQEIKSIIHEISQNGSFEDYVLLASSSLKTEMIAKYISLYDSISLIKDVMEIDESNICSHRDALKFTTMLSYKGLESKNVILLVDEQKGINPYELYVGMTRAIMSLQILIYTGDARL